jgi:metallophosphoesterase (TIGR00282 family)
VADLTILFIGDVVGKPGRRIVRRGVAALRAERPIDVVIVNGENAAGGSGITAKTAASLFAAGAHCITTGDHVFKQREAEALLTTDPRVLRPMNLSDLAAGRGVGLYAAPDGTPVAVMNLLGRVFMNPSDNPFRAVERALTALAGAAKVIVIDFHAEATSEKIALGRLLDGRVSAVLGTHTHVPTADERLLPGGTAYLTDVGMTGPYDSVLGRRTDRVLGALLTDMPQRFEVAAGDVRLGAAIVTVDPATGHATSIERVCVREDDLPPEQDPPADEGPD